MCERVFSPELLRAYLCSSVSLCVSVDHCEAFHVPSGVSVGPRVYQCTPPTLLAFCAPTGWPILFPSQLQPLQAPAALGALHSQGPELLSTWEIK